jgi:hypothetical protein
MINDKKILESSVVYDNPIKQEHIIKPVELALFSGFSGVSNGRKSNKRVMQEEIQSNISELASSLNFLSVRNLGNKAVQNSLSFTQYVLLEIINGETQIGSKEILKKFIGEKYCQYSSNNKIDDLILSGNRWQEL